MSADITLDSESLRNWLLEKGMNQIHVEELIRCVEVTKIVDEDILEWKRNH